MPGAAPQLPITVALRRPPDLAVPVLAIGLAVMFDLVTRSGPGLAAAVMVAVAAGGLLVSGRVENPHGRALVGLAPLFGLWLAVRSSPWLLPLDLLAAGGLVTLGAAMAAEGRVFDLSLPAALGRFGHALANGLLGLGFVASPLTARLRSRSRPGRSRLAGSVARGLALAAPVVILLGLLLGSADAVFASFFHIDLSVDPANVARHLVALGFGTWAMGGLLRTASAEPPPALRPSTARLGTVEAGVVLGGLVVLYAAFAVAQLVALSEGGRRVLETAGLTYAEYARSGFFQLLAAAALTLGVLLALRALTAREGRMPGILLALALVALALTLVVVAVSVRRLELYRQAFGLTMLRLYSSLFAAWIGAVLIVFGLALAGVARRRHWFPGAAVALGLALLLGLNVANPEAIVARDHVARARGSQRLDLAFISSLSADAIPALADEFPAMRPGQKAGLRAILCRRHEAGGTGWAAFNAAEHAARERLAEVCAAGDR